MLQIDNTIVSFDLIDKKFLCDISKCKGICCVAGDSGAPLDENELTLLEESLPAVYNSLLPESKLIIDQTGVAVFDADGDLVTNTLPSKGACVFTLYDDNNNAVCALEKAWTEDKISFRKPISCHLYPIRITKYKYYDAVNYHTWEICSDAVSNGENQGLPVYVFLKDALIRKYGINWYEQLLTAAQQLDLNRIKRK